MKGLKDILFAPVHRWLVRFRDYLLLSLFGIFIPTYLYVIEYAPEYELLPIYFVGMGLLAGVIPATIGIMFIEIRYGVTEETWSEDT